MDPNTIIDAVVDAIDYAEMAKDSQGLVKARRLLNNDLRQAIDQYVALEVARTLRKNSRRSYAYRTNAYTHEGAHPAA